jgi:hypothetical protein
MQMATLMKSFMKSSWRLPAYAESDSKHKKDSKAKTSHGELVESLLSCWSHAVLHSSCDATAHAALSVSLDSIRVGASPDIDLAPFQAVLDVGWQAPFNKLRGVKLSAAQVASLAADEQVTGESK